MKYDEFGFPQPTPGYRLLVRFYRWRWRLSYRRPPAVDDRPTARAYYDTLAAARFERERAVAAEMDRRRRLTDADPLVLPRRNAPPTSVS